jgi:hypothetical protein
MLSNLCGLISHLFKYIAYQFLSYLARMSKSLETPGLDKRVMEKGG